MQLEGGHRRKTLHKTPRASETSSTLAVLKEGGLADEKYPEPERKPYLCFASVVNFMGGGVEVAVNNSGILKSAYLNFLGDCSNAFQTPFTLLQEWFTMLF